MSLLEISDLAIQAGPLSLVDGVTLDIRPGEVVALVGESGSGKSLTALSAMGLLGEGLGVTGGQILFDGTDLLDMAPDALRRLRGQDLAMIFQEPVSSLNPLVPVGEQGDVYDRCQVRLAEIVASARIISQALEGIPAGAHRLADRAFTSGDVGTPEGQMHHFSFWMDGHGLQPPSGDVYMSVEAPGGELGLYLVSDGTDRPYRLRFRTPSFAHLQCYPHLVAGLDLDEVALVLGSLNIAAAEVDR